MALTFQLRRVALDTFGPHRLQREAHGLRLAGGESFDGDGRIVRAHAKDGIIGGWPRRLSGCKRRR